MHEPAAEHGAARGHDGREAGPCADSLGASGAFELCAEESEAVGDEERAADALEAAREKELADVAGDAATERGEGEEDDAVEEHLAAAEAVAEGAAGEQEG